MIEKRRYARTPLDTPASFTMEGGNIAYDGLGKDISIGGMFIETRTPAAFHGRILIRAMLPGGQSPATLPAIVRWVRDGGMGVQFLSLGAVETHLITEIIRRATTRD